MHINSHIMIRISDASDLTSMAADSSCSHWWHAPFYLAMSFTLAFIAISTARFSTPETPLPPHHALALNASAALRRRGGFHITATLLQISPELFFSGSQTTVFAIQDSAISNLSLPPSTMRQLLRYHAVPAALPMAELLKKPLGFCFETLVDGERLSVTKNDAESGSLTINNVSVSQPDLFIHGPLAVHGVVGPFETASSSPPCRVSNQSNPIPKTGGDRAIEWKKIIRLLSSNGLVSFAIGLNAVLDGILRDYPNLGSATVFAPPNSEFLSSPSPFLDRIVRLHILQRSFSFMELNAEGNSSLRTLVPGSHLEISKLSSTLAINGVEITRPDLFSSKNFAVHEISRDFDLEEFFSSFK